MTVCIHALYLANDRDILQLLLCLQLAQHDITINWRVVRILTNLKFSDDLYHMWAYKPLVIPVLYFFYTEIKISHQCTTR